MPRGIVAVGLEDGVADGDGFGRAVSARFFIRDSKLSERLRQSLFGPTRPMMNRKVAQMIPMVTSRTLFVLIRWLAVRVALMTATSNAPRPMMAIMGRASFMMIEIAARLTARIFRGNR